MSDSSTDDEALNGGAGVVNDNTGPSSSAGQASDESSQGANAGSPAATESKDDKKPASIADAVRAALSGGKEQSSGSGEGEGDAGKAPASECEEGQEEEDDELGELTEEELNSYKDKTQRRFKKLDSENKSLKAKLEAAEPEAQVSLAIKKFATDAGLSREDVNTGFNIMKLCRSTRREDHIQAYEAMVPMVNTLAQMIGVALPSDLQEQVKNKQLTPEQASEISQLRASARQSDSHRKAEEERTVQQRQEEAARQSEALKNDVGTAITNWESTWKAKDPDYSLKQRRVMEAVELELTRQVLLAKEGKPNNVPRSAQEAVKMADDIKKRVDKEMQRFIPRKQPINNPTGNGTTQNSKPVAKTIHEAVAQAVGFK